MRFLRWLIVIGPLIACLTVGTTRAAEPGDVATWRGVWNGLPLTVTVIAVDHPIPTSVRQNDPWWRWGNTTTDGYLFSFHRDDEVDLALVFTVERGRPVATVYVLREEWQRKGLRIQAGRIVLPRDTHPTVKIWPRQGEWLLGGQPNFDLEVDELDRNGAPAWHASIGGDGSGRPRWITRTLLQDRDPTQGYLRFGATMREDPTVPYQLAMPLMPSWPYLSVARSPDHWGDDRPIVFDPETRDLVMHWVGFQTAGVYSVNSLCPPPQTCFESPFAWYRFDPSAGRYANLVIRSDLWPKGVPFGPPAPEFYRTTFRMTWTARDAQRWRYSLTVTGDHPIDQSTTIGSIAVDAIPYAALPSWILERPWKAVTFVEATRGEYGSEGIYDYSVEDNYPIAAWVNGLIADPPTTFAVPMLKERPANFEAQSREAQASFQSPYLQYPQIHPDRLKEGLRGEYSLIYNRTPALYVSPVDRRVHLLHADGGLWNLGNGVFLRMLNLDGGPFINGWSREHLAVERPATPRDVVIAVPGEVEESLYALDGYLLYVGPDETQLRLVVEQLTNLDVPVPIDQTSWRQFLDGSDHAQLAPRDPWNLRSWLDGFPGVAIDVKRGLARDVRATADGFRFVLSLQRGFELEGFDFLELHRLAPGEYVVSYHRPNRSLTVQSLTPPKLQITTFPEGLLLERSVEARINSVGFLIANTGLADAKDVEVTVTAIDAEHQAVTVAKRLVTVFSGETTRLIVPWVPLRSGLWTLRITAALPAKAGDQPAQMTQTAMYEARVQVDHVSTPTLAQTVSGFGLVPPVPLIALLTAVLIVTALGLFYLLRFRPAR